MKDLKQSTAYDYMVFMTDSTDHVTGKTGLTLTITASKAGAAFASISPSVTERGNGWYSLALTTSHTDTLGDFALHITSSGADPTDCLAQVRANILGDTLPSNVTQLGGSTQSATDLKDFADDGYDPSTNKVQGVVLVDTLTTYTNNTPQTGDSFAIVTDAVFGNEELGNAIASIEGSMADFNLRIPAALVSGRMDSHVGAMANDTLTAPALASSAVSEIQAGLATQASVDGKPTLAQILAGGDIDGYTLEETLKLALAPLAGKLSGAGTGTETIRAADDSKDRIIATVDASGNRTAITLDATG